MSLLLFFDQKLLNALPYTKPYIGNMHRKTREQITNFATLFFIIRSLPHKKSAYVFGGTLKSRRAKAKSNYYCSFNKMKNASAHPQLPPIACALSNLSVPFMLVQSERKCSYSLRFAGSARMFASRIDLEQSFSKA